MKKAASSRPTTHGKDQSSNQEQRKQPLCEAPPAISNSHPGSVHIGSASGRSEQSMSPRMSGKNEGDTRMSSADTRVRGGASSSWQTEGVTSDHPNDGRGRGSRSPRPSRYDSYYRHSLRNLKQKPMSAELEQEHLRKIWMCVAAPRSADP